MFTLPCQVNIPEFAALRIRVKAVYFQDLFFHPPGAVFFVLVATELVRVSIGKNIERVSVFVTDVVIGILAVTNPQQHADRDGDRRGIDEKGGANDLGIRQPFKVAEVRVPERRRYRLRVTDGPDKGAEKVCDGPELSVGSADGNDLVLSDPTVSRHHFAIEALPQGFLMRDLDSTNGTTLHGYRVGWAYLKPGAVIGAGISGLGAARRIQQSGRDVVVFEAEDRVGGRIQTIRRGDLTFDVGAFIYLGSYDGCVDTIKEVGLEPQMGRFDAYGAMPRDGELNFLDLSKPVRTVLGTNYISTRSKLKLAKLIGVRP